MILAALLTVAAYVAFVLIAKRIWVDAWRDPLEEEGEP